jgi:hypothetical protein
MMFFYKNFFKFFINRKEPELELEPEPKNVISALAPGGNLFRLVGSWLRLPTTVKYRYIVK